MPDKSLYPMIFKRKSFHLFRNCGNETITAKECKEIEEAYLGFEALYPEISTEIRIVPAERTNCRCGQEYCILLYSETKDNYLANIGYLGQQLDLYLVSRNIGSLWFGLGKTKEKSYDGMDYVIMIAIRKVSDPAQFRRDMSQCKRKSVEDIWHGEKIDDVSNIVRFAPSACNSQPWLVERKDNRLLVYRYRKPGLLGVVQTAFVSYHNRIDIGIFLCFLNLCLDNKRISYRYRLHVDPGDNKERSLLAEYSLESGDF